MTEQKPIKKTADVMTQNEMCELFGLTPYEDPEGMWAGEYIWELYSEAIETRALDDACDKLGYDFDVESWEITEGCPECGGDGLSEERDWDENGYSDVDDCPECGGTGKVDVDRWDVQETPEYDKARDEAEDDLYRGWKNSVESVFEKFLGYVNIEPAAVKIRTENGIEDGYKLVPTESWAKSADEIVELINGYGYFWFNNRAELRESGPYTNKEAVLAHIHYANHYSEIYGGRSPQSVYEDSRNHYLYSW
jgi:hypothetical protein